MKLRRNILGTFVITVIAMIGIILIVLYPRNAVNVRMNNTGIEPPTTMELYIENIKNFFHEMFVNHSLGRSRDALIPTGEAVMSAMGRSIVIILLALVIGVVVGTLKGVMDYKLSKTKFNLLGNWSTWLVQSIPDFMLILIIQWIVIRYVRWIPFFPKGHWTDFIVPTILVSIYPVIYMARITSASIAMQEGQMYIQVARAKGITERLILFKHILKNSMSTLLTHILPLFGYILSNLLFVEIFTNYPGAASRLYMAISYFEPGVIIGISFCFMVLLFIFQVISQIAKHKLDPR
ncbi:ABC transporter permease [Paenibacillus albiflavus]|uniref:ABC transporter permease n=1 Tax=Paenibacillus albiflavus TaxID=2545760 RepID=A0A4R4E8U3_9BACL|nr:ABC transporter permease [Paenibacillus albiflavus]TCZ75280.1 ABC transporter permease [Paenibacillus albiflavus]